MGNANHGVLKVSHSSFISNSANNGYGAAGGGAIYNMYGDITVAHSSFASNAGANAESDGGAIYNSFHASAVNSVSVGNPNFTSNEAYIAGGAIWNGASLTVLLGTVFTNNPANLHLYAQNFRQHLWLAVHGQLRESYEACYAGQGR